MNRIHKILLPLILLVFHANANAESYSQHEVLTIDPPTSKTVNLEFSDTNKLMAKVSQFRILSSILMSNLSGERWATVTIKNITSYQRLLDKEHIIAIFADGEKRNPIQAEHKFSGHEETTIIINFGKSKFPILRVSVRN